MTGSLPGGHHPGRGEKKINLDIKTLIIVQALVQCGNLFFSCLMVASRRIFPGARSWLGGQASLVLGTLLYILTVDRLSPFFSLVIPNTLFFLSTVLILNALWHFRFERSLPRLSWASVVVFFLGFALLLRSTINARIVFFSAFAGAVELVSAIILLFGVKRELRLPCAVTGIAFALALPVHSLRLWDALAVPTIQDFYRQDALQSVLYVVAILSAYMMLFGYFMMTGMRYEIELREKDGVIRGRNADLKQLNDTNVMMMSVIAHDLRNPVGSAARYVRKHLLPPEIDLDAKRDAIRVLAKTLADTDDLLENLLLWARERAAPGAEAERSPLALDAVIRPALDAVAQSAAEKSITIAYEDRGLRVLAERNGSSVVFRNLLSNAVKFTPIGGTVTVDSREAEGGVEVTVSDTGRGMESEAVARLNGGGELPSTPGTAGEKGNGMGLSLCRRFMLGQGGGFRVESAPGEGSRFVLRFPGCA